MGASVERGGVMQAGEIVSKDFDPIDSVAFSCIALQK
jgi:hypothetical protein